MRILPGNLTPQAAATGHEWAAKYEEREHEGSQSLNTPGVLQEHFCIIGLGDEKEILLLYRDQLV